MTPFEAYEYALHNHTKQNFDLKYYQEIACQDPGYAFVFALYIPGADIEYCQEHACKSPYYSSEFAMNIPGADIEYCQEHACKSPEDAYYFAKYVPGANIEYCRNACDHDKECLDKFDKMIINKAML